MLLALTVSWLATVALHTDAALETTEAGSAAAATEEEEEDEGRRQS